MDDLKCINVKDLALLTGLGQQSIRQAISDKSDSRKLKLPKITRFGVSIRFRMDHVKEWLDERAGIAPRAIDTSTVQQTAIAASHSSCPKRPGRPRKSAPVLVHGAAA